MELFTPGHLIVLAIIFAVLFFGWKQLPDMARSMGKSMRIFKTEIKAMTEDDKARAASSEAPKALESAPVVPLATVQPTVTPIVQAQVVPPAPRPRPAPAAARPVIDAASRAES